jgi:hypothetical protein
MVWWDRADGEFAMKTTLAMALAAVSVTVTAANAQLPDKPTAPVVVELFQSQGCSSCPPAIANLNAIAGKPGVLALIFAVDYWDNLGWKDTFATHAYTQRQWDYARGLKHSEVATPQVVVNGRRDLVGGNARELDAAIAAAPKPMVPVTLTASQITVGVGLAPTGPADVWLVRYDPRVINVAIKKGENGGKTLAHKDVVKAMVRLGKWGGQSVSFPVPAGADPGLKVAVLVQQPGGPILGAAG